MAKDKSKPTAIRFNSKEIKILNEMGHSLGLSSRSAIIKCCLPFAKQRIDKFLAEFKDVIQPLKSTEITSLITTMSIIAKKEKLEREQLSS